MCLFLKSDRALMTIGLVKHRTRAFWLAQTGKQWMGIDLSTDLLADRC